MKKSIKKGFTLVELLVVIAIIAILSIVGIVGYVSFTNRARISNDTTIVTELNRVLQAEHVNKKPSTMQDVVDEIFDAGFDLTKLTPTAAKHHIVYDFEGDRFYLLNENHLVVGGEKDGQKIGGYDWDHWKVVQSYSEVKADGEFSYYLGKMKANEDEPDDGIKVSTGIDVGANAVSKIKYERTGSGTREVVIRTNGGSLTINAANDKVHHYEKADSLDIIAVAPSSYYENGTVGYAKIANGRLVVEETANIDGIYLVANDEGKFDEIKIAVVGEAQLPELARADVALAEGESKLVVEVQTLQTSEGTDPNPEFIWISNTGTTESPVVNATISSSKTDSAQTIASPTTVAAAVKEDSKESAAPITDNSVARINAVGFSSLKEAFEAAKNGDVITVLSDTDIAEIIVVENQLVLDLNGKTITNEVTGSQSYSYTDENNTTSSASGRAFVLTDESALTVNANGGKMVIPSTNTNSYGFFRVYTATLTLNGGEYSGNTNNGTFFHAYAGYGAEINLNNVVATTNYRFVASNDYVWGIVSVNGGTFTQDNTDLATSSGTIPAFYLAGFETTIEDATITSSIGECVEIAGYDPYTKATFKGNNNFTVLHSNNIQSWNTTAIAVDSHGKAIIESGTYTGDYGLYIFTSGGDVTINGGRFVGTKQAAVMSSFDSNNYGYDGWYAKVTINNGSFVGNVKTNGNSLASIEINGGDFTDATVAQTGVTDNRQ